MADDEDRNQRMNDRRRNFKKTIDADDFRRQREDETVQIRKKEKENELERKRR